MLVQVEGADALLRPPGDALGEEAVCAGSFRGRHEVARALGADSVVLGGVRHELAAPIGEVGELVDNRVRLERLDGFDEASLLEHVADDRLGAARSDGVDLARRACHSGDDVAVVDEQSQQADSEDTGRTGEEDPHLPQASRARVAGTKEVAMTEVAQAPGAERAHELKRITHWIGGEPVAGRSGRSGPVYNPARGVQTGEVDFASIEEVDRAVQAAKEAFAAWRAVSLSRKTEIFFRIRKLVDEHREDIAKILTAEHGKVLTDALGEVARGLEVIEFCCGIPELLKGGFTEQASTGVDVYSIRQPLGVAAGITPFNFPAMVPMWMWAPALACGNTFVLKPSEKDPSASVYAAELLKEAGVPDGVFNVVHGDKVAVDAVLQHPDIAAVSFVGSTPIARYVYEQGTSTGKRVQALGGAKNHMIVLPDADMDMAADAAVSAAYGSAGERCMAISQVVTVGDAGDRLVAAIKDRLPKIKVGDGLEPDAETGPVVKRDHRDKVAGYIDGARDQGADVVADGRESAPDGDGFFLGVSLLDNVTPEMDAYKDEIFGPVLGVTRVATYADAVRLVNENPYGNGTAIFTRDGGVARQFQFDVQAGMVGINVPIPVPVAYYSFGGWKSSLFGATHLYGPEGINFYTRGKVVTSRWPDPATSKVDLGFPQTR